MTVKYQSPQLHYWSFLVITITVYFLPYMYFFNAPEKLTFVDGLFSPPILLFVFFCLFSFRKNDKNTKSFCDMTRFTRTLLTIFLIETFLFLLSATTKISLSILSNSAPERIPTADSHFSTLWLGSWCFFALYTTAQHYFFHSEHCAPLAVAATYNFKKNYYNSVVKRAMLFFCMALNLLYLYTNIAYALLISLYFIQPHFTIGLNLSLIFILFLATPLTAALNLPAAKKLFNKLKLRSIYYFITAFALSCFVLNKTYSFILSPSFANNPLFQLLQNQSLALAPESMMNLFGYSVFLLAIPLNSSLIVKKSSNLTTRQLLISLMFLPALSLTIIKLLPTLPTYFPYHKNEVLCLTLCLIWIMVVLFSRRKETSDLFLGVLTLPSRQRVAIAGHNYHLFPSHIIVPLMLCGTFICFGSKSLVCMIITGAMLILTSGLLCFCALFSREKRLAIFHRSPP